jgi:hypothetical protein
MPDYVSTSDLERSADRQSSKFKDMMDWENRIIKTQIQSNSLSIDTVQDLAWNNRDSLNKLEADFKQLKDILKQLWIAHDKTRQELKKLKGGGKVGTSSGVIG